VHLHLILRNAEVFCAVGTACCSNATVGFHVGDVAGVYGRQVPDHLVVVLIHLLGRSPGSPAGDFHQLFTCSHSAFLVTEANERVHDVVIPDPEVRFEPDRLPIERERLAHRLFAALAGDGNPPVVEHIRSLSGIY